MKVIERQKHNRVKAARFGKPLNDCFKSKRRAELEWLHTEQLPGFLEADVHRASSTAAPVEKPSAPATPRNAALGRPADVVLEIFALCAHRVRTAQSLGEHKKAIRLTTRTLRFIRKQPKAQRESMAVQTLELLNLRSLSLIAVGECGEAWRCIALMAKLWPRGQGAVADGG